MKQTGNTILITGGGSGIGEALAHRFHDLGNTVIIAGRRKDVLENAAKGRATMHAIQADLDDAQTVKDFASRLRADHPTLNVVINNAGIMRTERLDQTRDLSDAEAMVTTNVLGPIRLIDALMDHLIHQKDATIINVTSGLAFVPMIDAATYSATKAALHSYTVSLRDYLKGKVEVIELIPPAVQTDLTPGQSTRQGYQPLNEFIDDVMTLFAQNPTPSEIAVERVRGLRLAESENRFDQTLATLTEFARKARHG